MVVRRLCRCRSWRNFRGNTRNDSWSRPCSHKCRCHRGCRTRHGEGAVESVVMCLGYGCGLTHSVSLCQIRFGINIPANVTSGEKPVWRACIRKGQYFSCPMRFPARVPALGATARALPVQSAALCSRSGDNRAPIFHADSQFPLPWIGRVVPRAAQIRRALVHRLCWGRQRSPHKVSVLIQFWRRRCA